MAVFFFLVGLEIKREVLEGNLSERDQIILPAVAAAGGMAAPALIFAWFNWGEPTIAGWAIPAATDIAFALGALSLLGSRVPPSLKVFLLTLATLDDLGAIIVIALFYTSNISLAGLAVALACLLVLIAFNRMRVDRLAPYLIVGLIMWVCVLKSGVHATLAGVLLALTIPLRRNDRAPLISAIEEQLHPYVKFLILPVFAFANAGVPLENFSPASLLEPLPLGIAAGLVAGKPAGILFAIALAVMLGLTKPMPRGSWANMAGVSCLAGIGFTMSLFIGGLAFSAGQMDYVRIGVIVGSILSLVIGLAILFAANRKPASAAGASPSASA